MKFKKLISVVLSVTIIACASFTGAFSLTASAATIEYDEYGISYTVSNGEATIIDAYFLNYENYDMSAEYEVNIPSSLEGYPVTAIADSAFYQDGWMTSITIPNTVTSIGNCAFLEGIGNLKRIVVAKDNKAYHSSNNCLIETKSKTLIAGCENSVIPSDGSVTSIGEKAFYWCYDLASISIPSSVKSIGEEAFYRCDSLTSISIPNSVTSIGEKAFYWCYSLTSISIPNSVTSIGEKAFAGPGKLTIYCDSGSYAENYAKSNNIEYVVESTIENVANSEVIENLIKNEVKFKEIAVNYPGYMINNTINSYIGLVEDECYEAIEDYSGWDIVHLSFMEGFFKGTEVITSELLSFLGKNTKGDEWIEEATLKLLQDVESQEMVIYDAWDTINETYKDIDFVYGATETISKYNLARSIAKSSKALSGETIGEIVDEAFDKTKELGISKSFDVTGKAFDIVDLTIYACQLYDAEIEIINRLLEFAPEGTTLHEGLTEIKRAREVDPAAYVISAFLKKEIASELGKLITKVGKYATSKMYNANFSITMEVVQLVMDVFYDYIYQGVKASDVTKAIILKEFNLTISNALTQKRIDIQKAHYEGTAVSQSVLDDYKFLWEARAASFSTYAGACADIAKDESQKSLLQSYEEKVNTTICFDNYVNCCMAELGKAIKNGTVVCKHYRNYQTRKVQSTCSSEGYTLNYCLTCGNEYVSAIDAVDGHVYVETVVNPTCENQGYTNYTCKNCRYSYNTNYTYATGHTYVATKINSTCLSKGYINHKCSSCGYAYNDNYEEVSGHTYLGWVTEFDSTCGEYGSIYNDCSICSERLYAKITKKEHTPSNDWIIVSNPTIYEEGLKHQVCTVCSDTVYEEIIERLVYFGDTDRDGKISNFDLSEMRLALIRALNYSEENNYFDANLDGEINIADLVRLKCSIVDDND